MSRIGGVNEGDPSFLRALIDCLRDQQSISDLIAPTADDELIRAQLSRFCESPVEIESIEGNDSRTDAVVAADGVVVARIVFARDRDGLLTWLLCPAR